MKRVFIISNPLAAGGRSAALLEGSQLLESNFERVIVHTPSELKNAAPSNTAAIVVFGGDGTVNRCLGNLAGNTIPVAIFPAGTVNDLALELGITKSWEALRDLLLKGLYAPLSLLEINDRKFAVYGTLGMGAETSRRLQQTRGALKTFRHAFPRIQTPLFTVLTIFFTRGYEKRLRLTLDGVSRELRTPGIYIANQRYVNRRIDLEWDRVRNPRQFRMIVFKPIGKVALIRAVTRFSETGRLSSIHSAVDVFDVESAVAESLDDSPIHFVADGEPLAEDRRLSISFAEEPLLVYRGGVR
jgi:diacylglycerol kinase family enzyme